MLKTSVDLRLRAILLLHEDHAHFDTWRTYSEDITHLQDGGTIHAMAIQKGPVATAVCDHALSICHRNFAVTA
jgi:hypothetical protein